MGKLLPTSIFATKTNKARRACVHLEKNPPGIQMQVGTGINRNRQDKKINLHPTQKSDVSMGERDQEVASIADTARGRRRLRAASPQPSAPVNQEAGSRPIALCRCPDVTTELQRVQEILSQLAQVGSAKTSSDLLSYPQALPQLLEAHIHDDALTAADLSAMCSFLAVHCKNLTSLDLAGCSSLRNVYGLGGLTGLRKLNLSQCRLDGVDLSGNPHLQRLDIEVKGNHEPVDLRSLAHLTRFGVNLSRSLGSELPRLSQTSLTTLRELQIGDATIFSNLEYLSRAVNLEKLQLNRLVFGNTPSMSNLVNLRFLGMQRCRWLFDENLTPPPSLQNLSITDSRLSRLDISNLRNLVTLNLNRSELKELELGSHPQLGLVDLCGSNLKMKEGWLAPLPTTLAHQVKALEGQGCQVVYP